MKRLFLPLALLAAPLASHASPLDAAHIPVEARWLAHFDLDAARATRLGQLVMEQLNQGTPANQLEAVKAMFGVDLRTDLHAITACGKSENPTQAALIVHAKTDPARLVTLLKANATYQSETIGEGLAVHSWIDDKRPNGPRQYAAFVGERIVISQGKGALARTAENLAGQGASIQDAGAAIRAEGMPGAIFAATVNLQGLAERDPKAAMLQKAESATVAVREDGEHLVGWMEVITQDDATAAQLGAMANGMLAFAQLNEGLDAQVKKLAQGLSVIQNGRSVRAQIKLPLGDLVERMREELRKHADRKNA
jgi:hypothetical protein